MSILILDDNAPPTQDFYWSEKDTGNLLNNTTQLLDQVLNMIPGFGTESPLVVSN